MGKIIVLDENTANKIAAGEVIERPASLVKELLENSIDAGATSISVEIKNGGITYIKITDNGSGIDEDDAELAFERHATSKIRNSEDLDKISTLGFRGEALASIAAVASVELTTRVRDKQHGTLIKIKGGVIKEVSKTGCPVGTTFIIRDLFYNTPARFKFLKKDSTEASYITDIITRVALSMPHISLKLISNGSLQLHTPGNNDLLSVIYSIYGKEASKNVSEINYRDSKLKITGYAGKSEISRASRANQSIYVNGRYIKSKLITSAIDEAYKTYLLKNKFAFIILNLELNPLFIDVNVHPTKMEIRFSEEQEVFRSVYHAIINALSGHDLIKEIIPSRNENNLFKINNESNYKQKYQQQNLNFPNISSGRKETGYDFKFQKELPPDTGESLVNTNLPEPDGTNDNSIFVNTDVRPSVNRLDLNKSTNIINRTEAFEITRNKYNSDEISNGYYKDNNKINEALTPEYEKNILDDIIINSKNNKIKDINLPLNINNIIEVENNIKLENKNYSGELGGEPEKAVNLNEFIDFKDSIIIGQLFFTYILIQKGEEVYIIDQHAAHERVRYEALKGKFYNNLPLSQELLAPIVIELTAQEIKFIFDDQEFFNRLGFSYENFGNNSIILRSVPLSEEGADVKGGFLEVVDRLLSKGTKDAGKVADETIYSIACKSAVKANKKLNDLEIRSLLDSLSKINNPFTCPHGRPTIVKLTKYELEKMFKRII